MKLSVFLATALASLYSMSVALPVDFSNALSTRDLDDVPSSLLSRDTFDWGSELYTRDLNDWESLDLLTRETAELDHLVARGGPNNPASAPPAKNQIPKPNLQCRKRGTGDECMNLFVVWYQPLGKPPHLSARHWALFLSEAADAAAVSAGAKGIIYEVVDDTQSESNFRARMVPDTQPKKASRYEGAKLLASQLTSPNAMDGWFEFSGESVLQIIAKHNNVKDAHHLQNPMNCQDFVVEMAAALSLDKTLFNDVPK